MKLSILTSIASLAMLFAVSARAEPRLLTGDVLLPFTPEGWGYDAREGQANATGTFLDFGVTNLVASKPGWDVAPAGDDPDMKVRVRLTLRDAIADPFGDIEVFGIQYERNPNPALPPVWKSVSETLHFPGISERTTTTFFDEITSIETDGLGTDVTLDVSTWSGHEQEISLGVVIFDVPESECADAYRVYFNGQIAFPSWHTDSASCWAIRFKGQRVVNGELFPVAAARGVYFGMPTNANDPYFTFNEGGHYSPPSLPDELDIESLGADDLRLRAIVVTLERQSDLHVIDEARIMLTMALDAFGNPSLVAMSTNTENAGAIAQLSPRGLDRLEQTHAVTLPYPIAPGETQPRLSERAIALPERRTASVTVNLAEIENVEYWTEKAPAPIQVEFAGYRAYQSILAEARGLRTAFDAALRACRALTPPWNGVCETTLRLTSCVESKPKVGDFRIAVDGFDTRFDPARPLDALTVGDVTHMELSFGGDEILADFLLEQIQGWLVASIAPTAIRLEWDTPLGDPCVLKPADRYLSDIVEDTLDYEEWLVCRDLSLAAPSGELVNPIPFDVEAREMHIDTPFAPFDPTVLLVDPEADPGTGICAEAWAASVVEDEILAWALEASGAIEAELVTTPGQDEALNRLVSPFELGVVRVDTPPAGTPPYDVHPLGLYTLSARITETGSDPVGLHTNAIDGLYVPYATRSSAVDSSPFLTWFCPVSPGQLCDGVLGDHRPMLVEGLDAGGERYDVALDLTTAHISQALWAQARREDRLGSPTRPARLDIPDTAVLDLATTLAVDDVVDALTAVGSRFGVRFHHAAAPFAVTLDTVGSTRQLAYVVPNIVVELVLLDDQDTEKVVAKFLVDVFDRDLQLTLRTGGAPNLTAAWEDLSVAAMTSTFLPDCHGARAGPSCDQRLRLVVGILWWLEVGDMLLEMIEVAPAPQLFDAGQESARPRHLQNVRTFGTDSSVSLVADLCNPRLAGCD